MLQLALFVLQVIIGRNWSLETKTDAKEFCQFDAFYGRCGASDVIVIESALYGRMKVGRCISGEGYIGCSTDVRPYMDGACAGRRHCNVTVTSLTEVVQPCRKDYTSYLEVAYSCREVVTDALNVCRQTKRREMTAPSGLLASVVTMETDTGSDTCPWEIRGRRGQQVRLTLIVYRPGLAPDRPGDEGPSSCPWSVVVEEEGSEGVEEALRETLCGRVKTEKDLMVSRSNLVRIRVKMEGRPQAAPVFLIQYEIVGCPDIVVSPSSGALVTRAGEEMVVRCVETKETWYLTCSGNSWIGDFENCSSTSHRSSQKFRVSPPGGSAGGIPFPQGLVVAVLLGLVLGLVVGSASLAALFVFRRRCCCRRHLPSDCRHGDDDVYATEKLRTTDYDPDGGYRSTFTGCPFGPDMTSPGTVVDEFPPLQPLPNHNRCLAGFYSAAGRSSAGTGNRECGFADVTAECATRLQSVTYETTRLGAGGCVDGVGVWGGGGTGICDSPKTYMEPEFDPKKKEFMALAT